MAGAVVTSLNLVFPLNLNVPSELKRGVAAPLGTFVDATGLGVTVGVTVGVVCVRVAVGVGVALRLPLGVAVGVFVGLIVKVGPIVGVGGGPFWSVNARIENPEVGDAVAVELPPPPEQLKKLAAKTNTTTGATTSHLSHRDINIEPTS